MKLTHLIYFILFISPYLSNAQDYELPFSNANLENIFEDPSKITEYLPTADYKLVNDSTYIKSFLRSKNNRESKIIIPKSNSKIAFILIEPVFSIKNIITFLIKSDFQVKQMNEYSYDLLRSTDPKACANLTIANDKLILTVYDLNYLIINKNTIQNFPNLDDSQHYYQKILDITTKLKTIIVQNLRLKIRNEKIIAQKSEYLNTPINTDNIITFFGKTNKPSFVEFTYKYNNYTLGRDTSRTKSFENFYTNYFKKQLELYNSVILKDKSSKKQPILFIMNKNSELLGLRYHILSNKISDFILEWSSLDAKKILSNKSQYVLECT